MQRIKKVFQGVLASTLAVLMTVAVGQTFEDLVDPPPSEWPQHGRDISATRYSPLDDINAMNVDGLGLAWARDLGFQDGHQGSPAVWNGIMYVSTATGVIALDATNGDEIWEFDRPNEGEVIDDTFVRGSPVVYQGNVFFTTRYGLTVAVDAETGEEVWSAQLTDESLNEGFSTNPIFADGKLIVGRTGADSGAAPGRISAVDVENGEILWTFNTVPLSPDDPAFDTWVNAPSWEDGIGGGSPWNAGAYDPVTETVVYGIGQPNPWDRIDERRRDPEGEEPSRDLYTASFVGLDPETGELKWYHQVVPADEWDYDQHTVPMFVDLEIDGETRRVALLATTTGYVVVLDADSGEFIAAHQKHPDPTVHTGYEDDGTPIIDDSMRHTEEGQFRRVCPGLRWAHIAPGAFSPETGLMYRPNDLNCLNYAAATVPDDWQPGERAFDLETGPKDESYWFDGRVGGVSAIDPTTGETVWEWGHYYSHNAGPVVTAGGLVFTAAEDRMVRALDASTGDVLWQQSVTATSEGGTITYAVDDTQYVATIVGGSGGDELEHPDAEGPPTAGGNGAVFVFALP